MMLHYNRDEAEAKSKGRRRFSRSIFGDDGFRVGAVQSQATKFDIQLFGPIEEVAQFADAIEVLQEAGEQDLVVLHLSTPGGSVDATDSFLHYWNECRARKIVIASGGVHSAGSMILLAADEFQLSENFNCLIHVGSFGAGGKTSDVASQVAFEVPFMTKLMRRVYEGFLTEQELDQLVAGKDFWFDNDEFLRRVHVRAEVLGETLDTSLDE